MRTFENQACPAAQHPTMYKMEELCVRNIRPSVATPHRTGGARRLRDARDVIFQICTVSGRDCAFAASDVADADVGSLRATRCERLTPQIMEKFGGGPLEKSERASQEPNDANM